jgi:hypothetical protein
MCVKETVAPLSAETDVMILKNIYTEKLAILTQIITIDAVYIHK